MKNYILLILGMLLITSQLYAQTPQIVVVKPNGVSSTYSTWDLAYAGANDGDNVYLPGYNFGGTMTLRKRLNIYGTGIHPDSTNLTGITSFNNAQIFKGASGGRIEGVKFRVCDTYYQQFGVHFGPYQNDGEQVTNFTIIKCDIGCIKFGSQFSNSDSLSNNIFISENIFRYGIIGNGCKNLVIKKNTFGALTNILDSEISNNIIQNSISINNCLIKNNIFITPSISLSTSYTCGNTFSNNLTFSNSSFWCCTNSCENTLINTLYFDNLTDIFNNYNTQIGLDPFKNDLHLKATSVGFHAGTDGTDVGIYGTASPTPAGWIPSNPHIFYKTIAPETAPDGKLNIHVKVRTNN